MPGCAAVGTFAKVLAMPKTLPSDANPTFNASSERYTFLYETLSANKSLIGTRAITGTLDPFANNLTPQQYIPGGQIGFQPGPADLDIWIPRIIGGTKSGNLFTAAENLPIFDLLIHRDNGVFHYKNCRVSRAVIRGRSGPSQDEGEILNLNLSIIAEDEDEAIAWPGTEPAIPTGVNRTSYNFVQGILTVASTAYPLEEFTLMIDNRLQVKHRNSISPSCVFSAGRVIRLETSNPFTAANWTMAGTLFTTGSNVSLKFANGLTSPNTRSLDFQLPLVRASKQTPSARGRGEIPLSLKMQAFRTSSNAALVVENISA